MNPIKWLQTLFRVVRDHSETDIRLQVQHNRIKYLEDVVSDLQRKGPNTRMDVLEIRFDKRIDALEKQVQELQRQRSEGQVWGTSPPVHPIMDKWRKLYPLEWRLSELDDTVDKITPAGPHGEQKYYGPDEGDMPDFAIDRRAPLKITPETLDTLRANLKKPGAK